MQRSTLERGNPVSTFGLVATAAILLATLPSPPVWAAGTAPPPRAVVKKEAPQSLKKKKKALVPHLRVGLNFAFSQSQGVVGIPDGISMALGLHLQAGLTLRRGPHAWLTRLSIQETQTKVPGVEPFIKGTDRIEVSSEYSYRFRPVPWLSVYGGLRLVSALIEGSIVRTEDTRLELTPTSGPVFTEVARAQKPYPLTPFLSPALFKQGVGAEAAPIKRRALRLGVRLGLAAVEAWTQGGYIVQDDKATDDLLELVQLRDYVQGGAELQLSLSGIVLDRLVTYALLANVMVPFATSVTSDLTAGQRINTELRLVLSLKLFRWAALSYTLSVLRFPLITPRIQVSGNLMLSVSADIGQEGR